MGRYPGRVGRDQLLAVLAFAVLALGVVVHLHLAYPTTGDDLTPYIRAAGKVLARQGDVYADPYFVYPPTMALAFIPFAHAAGPGLFFAFGLTELWAVGVACVLAARALGLRRWLEWGCVAAAVTICAQVSWDALVTLNVNAYLLPLLVLTAAFWADGRWEAGCYTLAATAVVKPIFAPLLLLPLVRGEARALLRPGAVLGALVAGSARLVPGGWGVIHLPNYVAHGIGMHGKLAIWNISIAGQAHHYGLPMSAVLPVRLLVWTVVAVLVLRARSAALHDAGTVLILSTALLLGTFLAGSMNEMSYTLLLAPGIFAAALRTRGPGIVLVAAGTLLLVLPHAASGGVTTNIAAGLLVILLAEALLFAGLTLAALAQLQSRDANELRQVQAR
jgi:arabinofuranan 3-O-arabinosyltransferase